MNDRELLELAAKAAGYTLYPEWDCAVTGIFLGQGCEGDLQRVWDPLTDDGDALRLAFVAELKVDIAKREVWYCKTPSIGKWLSIGWDGDIEGLRRAIVLAAAEMGRVE